MALPFLYLIHAFKNLLMPLAPKPALSETPLSASVSADRLLAQFAIIDERATRAGNPIVILCDVSLFSQLTAGCQTGRTTI